MPSIEELADAKGYPTEVKDAVLRHAHESNTAHLIESGELQLPHPIDAAKFFDLITGKNAAQREQEARDKRLLELEERIRQLEGGSH